MWLTQRFWFYNQSVPCKNSFPCDFMGLHYSHSTSGSLAEGTHSKRGKGHLPLWPDSQLKIPDQAACALEGGQSANNNPPWVIIPPLEIFPETQHR